MEVELSKNTRRERSYTTLICQRELVEGSTHEYCEVHSSTTRPSCCSSDKSRTWIMKVANEDKHLSMSNLQGRVALIIPTYNSEGTIFETLRIIQGQKYWMYSTAS